VPQAFGYFRGYLTQLKQTPQASYLTADHLGSPRVVTDEAGNVVSRHDYMAFGSEASDTIGNVANRTTAQGYQQEDEIRKQYTGYERDDESGLDFAQARYYNSSHGRFTSVDPLTASANLKNPQTFNRYSYVLNSPYKFVDPLGFISLSA
jgi:RHS repeat-associated protein